MSAESKRKKKFARLFLTRRFQPSRLSLGKEKIPSRRRDGRIHQLLRSAQGGWKSMSHLKDMRPSFSRHVAHVL